MNEIVSAAKTKIMSCKTTGDIRKLSAELFKNVKDKSKENVFLICDGLLEQQMLCIAFDFAYRMKKQYDENTFSIFERWLKNYVRGWGDCDDFCVHSFGELVCQRPELISDIIVWTEQEEFWMRRAAAVVLIPAIRRNKYQEIDMFQISDLLMPDKHYLVLKGYGWMLKEYSKKEPELVFEYLLKNKAVMPRLAYRYALGKMDAEKKKMLMSA